MTVPTRSDFVRIRGLRHHVRVWGCEAEGVARTAMDGRAGGDKEVPSPAMDGSADLRKPQLWLLPGWLDTAATWAPVAEALADRWQVFSPDWRGIGHTEWPQDGYWFYDYVADFDALIAHYSPAASILLVGHSMGAQIASLYAGLRPDKVRRLVCLDGLFLPDMEAKLAPKRFVKWLEDLKEPLQPRSYDSFEVLAQRVKKQHPQLSDDRALFIAHGWGYTDGHGRVRLLADPRHYLNGPGLYKAAESMEIWKNVIAPTLFVDAGKSPFVKAIPPDETARRRACFREHRAQRIEEAGHMLHFDAPEATARVIADFMSG